MPRGIKISFVLAAFFLFLNATWEKPQKLEERQIYTRQTDTWDKPESIYEGQEKPAQPPKGWYWWSNAGTFSTPKEWHPLVKKRFEGFIASEAIPDIDRRSMLMWERPPIQLSTQWIDAKTGQEQNYIISKVDNFKDFTVFKLCDSAGNTQKGIVEQDFKGQAKIYGLDRDSQYKIACFDANGVVGTSVTALSDRFIRGYLQTTYGINFESYAGKVVEDRDRNYYITVHDGNQPSIRKYSPAGNEEWSYNPKFNAPYQVLDMYSGLLVNDKENTLIYGVGHNYYADAAWWTDNDHLFYSVLAKLDIASGTTIWENINLMSPGDPGGYIFQGVEGDTRDGFYLSSKNYVGRVTGGYWNKDPVNPEIDDPVWYWVYFMYNLEYGSSSKIMDSDGSVGAGPVSTYDCPAAIAKDPDGYYVFAGRYYVSRGTGGTATACHEWYGEHRNCIAPYTTYVADYAFNMDGDSDTLWICHGKDCTGGACVNTGVHQPWFAYSWGSAKTIDTVKYWTLQASHKFLNDTYYDTITLQGSNGGGWTNIQTGMLGIWEADISYSFPEATYSQYRFIFTDTYSCDGAGGNCITWSRIEAEDVQLLDCQASLKKWDSSLGASTWDTYFPNGHTFYDVAVGRDKSYTAVGLNHDHTKLYVANANPTSGAMNWEKEFSSGTTGWGITPCIENGGYIIAGTYHDTTTNMRQAILLKIDKNGNEEWHKYFRESPAHESVGRHAIETADRGFIMVGGSFYGTTSKVYSVKTNRHGEACSPGVICE